MRYIETKALGRLPRIALGCDRFGLDVDGKTALGEIECYLENGGFVLDTAHAYGQREDGGPSASEILIGEFLRGVERSSVFLATKGGLSKTKVSRLDRASLTSDVEMSLEHLRTIPDLWYFHRDNPAFTVEELMDTAFTLRKKGMLKHIGASNWSVDRIEKANAYAESIGEEGFVAVENQFSLAYTSREIWGEADMEHVGSPRCSLSWFEETGMPNFCYSSQGRGILQKIIQGKTELGKASRFMCRENVARAERLMKVSGETGIDPTDLILSYVTSQKAPFVAIIGSYNIENIKRSLKAADIVLDEETLGRLEGRA